MTNLQSDPKSEVYPNVKSEPYPNQEVSPSTKAFDKDMVVTKYTNKETGLVNPTKMPVSPVISKKNNDDWNNKNQKYKMVDDVSLLFNDDGDEDYPYESLKVEQAFFVPTMPNNTTDDLLADVYKSIERAKKRYGEIEVDEKGDEIWETVLVMSRKRNPDGTIQLESNGKPVTGCDQTTRPKYIYTRNFITKAVVAGQKLADGVEAEADGVVVIRVA